MVDKHGFLTSDCRRWDKVDGYAIIVRLCLL